MGAAAGSPVPRQPRYGRDGDGAAGDTVGHAADGVGEVAVAARGQVLDFTAPAGERRPECMRRKIVHGFAATAVLKASATVAIRYAFDAREVLVAGAVPPAPVGGRPRRLVPAGSLRPRSGRRSGGAGGHKWTERGVRHKGDRALPEPQRRRSGGAPHPRTLVRGQWQQVDDDAHGWLPPESGENAR